MPEMPEVEIIRRGLRKNLIRRRIKSVDILLARQIKHPDENGFRAAVTGRTIANVGRVGKYLLIELDDGSEIVFHLRMTGHLVYVADTAKDSDKYARLCFNLDDGSKLIYGDSRTLGVIYAIKKGERGLIKTLAQMGAEPLSADFTPQYLREKCHRRKIKIKQLLLEQKSIGGIGNIYADEALFKSRINPTRIADTLSDEETKNLFAAINQVIADGIADGGTTFRDYQNADGKSGRHQENLFVYGREKKTCRICGATIEKITVGGRGTHFCPRCQK